MYILYILHRILGKICHIFGILFFYFLSHYICMENIGKMCDLIKFRAIVAIKFMFIKSILSDNNLYYTFLFVWVKLEYMLNIVCKLRRIKL